MLQTLLTPLLITLVVCGMLFFYFRNRLALTERKVNLMFDLIQEHEKRSQLADMQYRTTAHHVHGSSPSAVQSSENSNGEPGLIDISDSESGDSDSDSDSDSDDSDHGKITLTEQDDGGDLPKIVTLTLAGAENGPRSGSLQETADPQEVSKETLDKMEIKEVSIEPDAMTTASNLNDINLSDGEHDDEGDDDDDEGDDDTEDSSDTVALESKNGTVVKKLESEKPLEKRSVKQLKAECATRGLTGYKKMKKSALINLLTENSTKESTSN